MRYHSQLSSAPTLICFCHLRWNFVYQRPQHVISRWGLRQPVLFVEEPIFGAVEAARFSVAEESPGVLVLTPHLPNGLDERQIIEAQRTLLDEYLKQCSSDRLIAWYYTPMALPFSDHIRPDVTVYDCMDELSAFQGAPPQMVEQERRLFDRADVVFAGGRSLYEAKRVQHSNVHLFASSIDHAHFVKARYAMPDPADQRQIPHPRIGYYGVLDERLDVGLLAEAARIRPDLHFILIGPVVKIQEQDLPRGANLHYLGSKSYTDLPQYLANWSVAMLPFARNESTRFISPTKTPEYLFGGRPVVSTPIQDVMQPYADMGLVRIASTAHEFVNAIDLCVAENATLRLDKVDHFLADMSWDKTFEGMLKEVNRCARIHSSLPVRERSEELRVVTNV